MFMITIPPTSSEMVPHTMKVMRRRPCPAAPSVSSGLAAVDLEVPMPPCARFQGPHFPFPASIWSRELPERWM